MTVCNHASAVDDPGVLAAMLPWRDCVRPTVVRWTLCATDRCFRTRAMAAFFKHVKVLPVERGAGIEQPLLADVVRKLSRGDWVHMFPEGRRYPAGTLGPMRSGVGRLIAEAEVTPLVVPFYHVGMHDIQPVGCGRGGAGWIGGHASSPALRRTPAANSCP